MVSQGDNARQFWTRMRHTGLFPYSATCYTVALRKKTRAAQRRIHASAAEQAYFLPDQPPLAIRGSGWECPRFLRPVLSILDSQGAAERRTRKDNGIVTLHGCEAGRCSGR